MSRRFTTPLFAVAALISASADASAEKRFFTVAAVEPKGATTAEKEPYPAEALPAGGGYVIKQPDPTGRGRYLRMCGSRARSSSTKAPR